MRQNERALQSQKHRRFSAWERAQPGEAEASSTGLNPKCIATIGLSDIIAMPQLPPHSQHHSKVNTNRKTGTES